MRRRMTTLIAVALLPLLLAACFLIPGKFASTLDVRRDGQFTFAYTGEIVLISPATLSGTPLPDPATMKCFGPVPGATVVPPPPPVAGQPRTALAGARPCTPDEIAKRTADATASRQREGEQMAKLVGMDPNDAASMRDYAAQVAKQAGWRSAVYRGNGVFDVDFAQTGRLDRDFVFPVLPKASVIAPFVIVRKRSDGAVLVTAPAFRAAPTQALFNGINSMQAPKLTPEMANGPSGSFTVTSDLAPLTNNTDDGPVPDGGRTRMTWPVSPSSDKVPETLIPIGH